MTSQNGIPPDFPKRQGFPVGQTVAQSGLQTSGLDAVLDYEGNRKKPFAIALVIA